MGSALCCIAAPKHSPLLTPLTQPLLDERYERFFSMYKLNVKDIYYVSGFGVMSTWVTPSDFMAAEADPLADFSSALIEGWNKNCQKEYHSVARAFFQVRGLPSHAEGLAAPLTPNLGSGLTVI